MNTKMQEYRKKIADAFIQSLKESPGQWKQEWSASFAIPVNAVTGRKYHSINRFLLGHIASVQGYEDHRWCTFNQIRDKGWHLKKGSKGVQIEYWMPYNQETRKVVSWELFQKLDAEDKEKHYKVIPKYFVVFNGNQIDGIPPLPQPEINNIQPAEIIEKISRSMGVTIRNVGTEAFYNSKSDSIYLPLPSSFTSDYAYNSTALHELSHATGHPTRLNRSLGTTFGSSAYAYEELIAEISSCFMSAGLPVEQTPDHIRNHKAYVQSWIQKIEEKPETLMAAIKEAENAANYLEYHAGLITDKEFNQIHSMTVPADKVAQLSKKEIAAQRITQNGSLRRQSPIFPISNQTVNQNQSPLNVIQGILCTDNISDGRFVKNTIRITVRSQEEVTMPIVATGSAAVSLLSKSPGDKISFVGELIKDGKTDFGYEIKKIDDSGLLLTATDKLLSDYIKTRDTAKYEVKNTVKEKNSTIEMEK